MLRRCVYGIVLFCVALLVLSTGAVTSGARGEERAAHGPQIDPKADEICNRMCDVLTSLKQFSFEADDMIDEVLDSGQKIQYANHRKITVRRPDRLAGESTGDLDNERVFYDGRTLTIMDKPQKIYGVMEVPGNIQDMLDFVVERFNIVLPLADLIVMRPYKSVRPEIDVGRYLGLHYADGVKCHHMAFRQANVDWQIWIDAGERPLPRKMVITYREVPGQPQYIAILKNWDLSPKIDESQFKFTPTGDVKKVDVQPIIERPGATRTPGAKARQ